MASVDTHLDSEDTASENESAKVQRTARLRKSCELCRTQKARCISSEGSDRCQRCSRNDSKCVFLAAKARPKKAMSSKARVAEMEQKLDGLMAMLEARNPTQTITPELTPTPTERDSTSPLIQEKTANRAQMLLPLHQQPLPTAPQDLIFTPWSTPSVDGFSDVISKGLVTDGEVEEYVRFFRLKTVYFPFVVVPMSATVDSLRREKPFLLLVIILFGCAQTYSAKQKIIENEVLEVFAKKSIVEGEKSMDLLQGLLVYVGQYHYFFNPKVQQIYQNSQLLISMAVELGINKVTNPESATCLDIISFLTPNVFHHKLDPTEAEARRTLLGVYVISSSVARCVRQSNNIKYNAFIGECCSFLSQASLSEHDHLIQYFVRMQQFQDEVSSTFDYDELNDLPRLDCARIETLLSAFNTQLQHFQENFPKEIWDNPQMMLKFHYLRTYLYEVAFHTDPLSTDNMSMDNWYHSTTRTSTLLSCLFASKSYIEYILALPTPAFTSLSLVDFTCLVYCVLVLGCFATPGGGLSLTLSTYQELANLQYYLDALVTKTSDIMATGTAPGYLLHFNFLFKDTTEWYARAPAGPGVKGKCITDLVGDMFPVAMKYAAENSLVIQYDGLFGVPQHDGAVNEYSGGQNTEMWPDLDVVLSDMWTGDTEFGTGNDALMNNGML